MKRWIIVIDWCCMCERSGETVDHLLLYCRVARVLWDDIFSMSGLAWIMHVRLVDLLAS